MGPNVDKPIAAAGPHLPTVRGVDPSPDTRGQDLVWDITTKLLDVEELYAAIVADIQTCRGLCNLDALVMNQASWLQEADFGGWTGLLVNETVCAIRSIHKPSRTFEVSLGDPKISDLTALGHYARAYFRARTMLVRSTKPLNLASSENVVPAAPHFQLHGQTTGHVFTAGRSTSNYWYTWKVSE